MADQAYPMRSRVWPATVRVAGSRRRADLACALVAGAGVVALARPQPTTDYAGIGLGLLAGTCWACYILLSSALPYLTDLFALRRVPARHFGIFMSVNPVLAAVIGLVVLGQSLTWSAWLSIAAIVGANAATSIHGTGTRQCRPSGVRLQESPGGSCELS